MGPSFPWQAVCLTSSAASSERPRQQCRTPLPVKTPSRGLFCQQPAALGPSPLIPQCSAALVGPQRSLQPRTRSGPSPRLPCTEPVHRLFPSLPGGKAKRKRQAAPRFGPGPREVGRGTLREAPAPSPDPAGEVKKGAEQESIPCTRNSDHRSRASPLTRHLSLHLSCGQADITAEGSVSTGCWG